jgi:hypothetical protein
MSKPPWFWLMAIRRAIRPLRTALKFFRAGRARARLRARTVRLPRAQSDPADR